MQNEDINKKEIKKNCKRKNANVIDKAKYLRTTYLFTIYRKN